MRRLSLTLTVLAALGLCSAATAAAPAKPATGAWKFGDADGGFSVVAGKGEDRGKLFITNVHSRTQNFVGCPEASERITVSGRFPLKYETLNGSYPTWAVGKPGVESRYSDGNSGLISIPAKVKVNGKPAPGGGFKMEFSYEDPTAFALLIIEFGGNENAAPCVTYAESASRG
jgi:hypothetical protein